MHAWRIEELMYTKCFKGVMSTRTYRNRWIASKTVRFTPSLPLPLRYWRFMHHNCMLLPTRIVLSPIEQAVLRQECVCVLV